MSATDPRTDAAAIAITSAARDRRVIEQPPDEVARRALAAADAVDTRVQQLTEAWVDAQIAGLQRSSMTEATRGALNAFMRVKEKLAEVDASPKEDA